MDGDDDRLATAEALFTNKMYVKSAVVFASTSLPVEDVFLRFVPLNEPAALKELLLAKLVHSGDDEITQITLLTFWLLELILQTLEETTNAEDRDLLRAELRSLLSDRKIGKCIIPVRSKVYELLASFGDEETLLYFAHETRDYRVIVDFHVRRNMFLKAIEVLQRSAQADLVCHYASLLMKQCPRQTVSMLISLNYLDPFKVLPSLLYGVSQATQSQSIPEVIRYLEHQVYVKKSREKVLLNQLLVLYAEHEPEKFSAFLDDSSTAKFNFDILFVLRVAEELQMVEACVKLLRRMGLYEDAVDRAVSVNMSLAKEVARDPQHDERFRKKLWLKIAEKVVSDGGSFTEFVEESDTVAVPDLLPLLPDFQTISLFKRPICKTLEDYTGVLEGLKEEMKEAADNLEEIKEELKQWRKESVTVSATSKCSACHQNVFFSLFYAFPCQHLFHVKCIGADPDECLFCGEKMIESICQPPMQVSGQNTWV